MALVVVGGQARKVGKTSVIEGIIRSTPEMNWTAVKLTHHLRDGQADPVVIEQDLGSGDSSRFAAAGAKASVLLRVMPGHAAEALTELQRRSATENLIIESVGVVEFLTPDAFLLVVDPANEDFKDSARKLAKRASAILAHPGEFRWPGVKFADAVPVFRISREQFVTPEVIRFVRERSGLK